MTSPSFYTLSMHIKPGLNDDQAGAFCELYAESALSFSCKKNNGGWDFLWTLPAEPSPNEASLEAACRIFFESLGIDSGLIGDMVLEAQQDRNWLEESYRALPPLLIGSFFVYGSHYTDAIPPEKIPLLIEAATAFGSGEHGTTSRCMMAIEHVKNSGFNPERILDMGCGSGILAAAAAKLWPNVDVHAADNDQECVIVTKRHAEANRISNIRAYESDGYHPASPIWDAVPFDFIIANILAAPLIDMAKEQSRALAHGGYLILSGTLKEQAAKVIAAYTQCGLERVESFPGDEWMTLLMRKPF